MPPPVRRDEAQHTCRTSRTRALVTAAVGAPRAPNSCSSLPPQVARSASPWRAHATLRPPGGDPRLLLNLLTEHSQAAWLPSGCSRDIAIFALWWAVIGPRWGSSSVFWGTQGHLGVCRCTLNVLSTMLNAPRNTLQQELILTPSISASLGGMRRRPLIQLIVATQTVVAARPLLRRRIEGCARMHLRRIIQLWRRFL